MTLKVHSIHFDADKKLISFVEERVTKLTQFFDHIVAGDVFLRLDKSKDMDNKVVEIKLTLPGREIFAKKQCKSFEEAADSSVEALRRQIRKYKGKLNAV
jgi:putative sigma-54 modulation protein